MRTSFSTSTTMNEPKIVYISRRAYESGEIKLLLRTDAVCDTRDTGWQLLQGSETGLELVNPANGLLISVQRALELMPSLAPQLLSDTPPENIAYTFDEMQQTFLRTEMPEDIPTS